MSSVQPDAVLTLLQRNPSRITTLPLPVEEVLLGDFDETLLLINSHDDRHMAGTEII